MFLIVLGSDHCPKQVKALIAVAKDTGLIPSTPCDASQGPCHDVLETQAF